MAYMIRSVNEQGEPVDLFIDVCWRCGMPVVTNLVSMDEHVDRAHPPRHYAEDPPTP